MELNYAAIRAYNTLFSGTEKICTADTKALPLIETTTLTTKNTESDSLTFLTNIAAFVIITLQSAWDMTQKASLLCTNFILMLDFVQHVAILEENVGMQTPHHVYHATPIGVQTPLLLRLS